MTCVKTYPAPPIDRAEILRYMHTKDPSPELEQRLDACLAQIGNRLTYRVCYREFPILSKEGVLDLGFAKTSSKALMRHVSGCRQIVIFAATLGLALDREITRQSAVSPATALLWDSIGNERIEALCAAFDRDLSLQKKEAGFLTRPRFSPGYGDLPLTFQKEIFAVLDCPRKIGLSLNESLLMTPSKSVTAIIGIEKCTGE